MLFTYVGGHPFSFFFERGKEVVTSSQGTPRGRQRFTCCSVCWFGFAESVSKANVCTDYAKADCHSSLVPLWKDPQWTCAQYVVSARDGEIRNKVVEEVENGQNSHNDPVLMAISWKIEMLHRNGAYGIFVF